ncbi:pimeloyl-ACP methyl ester carboxylesterase [Mycolicibacterium sp. BK556]|uniref:alpha/beta fold hydrolase n=1 Tax=unclassified Mycolicibacterium TaxID=2636767 RepID=UPI00161F3248|nr:MULTISPECIES: alpha/beta fold hydrolase [unclassified Mycolicibacterium]MBB3601108.1 pimeloyl-ACP methyl ester carboxylesterase [Mycolicibacterium sp. BK556]MBB3630862.1 pimeloyl-ACP methyl ester carboxylesterase [Mycolicibacterium sp. BK607]
MSFVSAPHWTAVDWTPWVKNRLVGDRRLRYLDYGTGPALVLLHGMAASWQWWLENIPALAQHHRVIAVDLPGCGHSEPLPAPAEISTHAGTVLNLLAQLGIDEATVVGHSMGGLVAIAMAGAATDRVRGLILVDAGGVPMTPRRLALILWFLRLGAAVLQRGPVRRALVRSPRFRRLALRAGFRNPDTLSPELAAELMPVFAGPGFVDSVAASGRAARATVPASLECPVLIIWGERDVIAPVRCAQDMHDAVRDSELVVIRDVGHSQMIESPDAFSRAVLDFTAAG